MTEWTYPGITLYEETVLLNFRLHTKDQQQQLNLPSSGPHSSHCLTEGTMRFGSVAAVGLVTSSPIGWRIVTSLTGGWGMVDVITDRMGNVDVITWR